MCGLRLSERDVYFVKSSAIALTHPGFSYLKIPTDSVHLIEAPSGSTDCKTGIAKEFSMTKKRRQPNLPPRMGDVKRQLDAKKTGRAAGAWGKYSPILLALLACGVFAFLIVTGLGVRLLIVRHGDSGSGEVGVPLEKFADAPKATLPETTLKNDAPRNVPALSEITDQKLPGPVNESGYQVLPPLAAAKKDRSIPGLLYVGDEQGMFEQVHEALQAMVPGDIVEIRTNRILTVEPCVIGKAVAAEIEPLDLPPLMIRAAEGYFPVLRVAQAGAVIKVHHRSIWLKNLHFAARDIPMNWIEGEGITVLAQSCSFTGGNFVSALGALDGRVSDVFVDRCFVRGCFIAAGLLRNVGIYRSGFTGHSNVVGFGPGEHLIDIRNSTFLQTNILSVGAAENAAPPRVVYHMDKCIFQQFACCPHLLNLGVPAGSFPADAENIVAVFNQYFPDFRVTNSLLSFHVPDGFGGEGWGQIQGGASVLAFRSSVFPVINSQLHGLGFSPRASASRDGIWNGQGGKDPAFPAAGDLDRPDFIFTSEDAAVQKQLDSRNVGCIPEWLPPVPLQTLDVYPFRPAG